MKPKQTQPIFSSDAIPILKEILRYIRFKALNAQRKQEPINREIRSIRRILEAIYE